MSAKTIYEAPRPEARPGESVVTSTCGHNCGGRCVVNAHVVDDKIIKISTDQRRWNPDHPPLPACARGVGQIEKVYHPDRLKYPMRRFGPRGSGEFERISWDEALDEIAAQLLRVRETYGNAAILDGSRSGNTSILHNRNTTLRFLNLFGGCTEMWSNMSAEAEVFSVRTTFGDKVGYKAAGREPTDYVNSKLIIMWGWSPGDGTFGTGTMQYLKHAKEHGVRIICVDPRRHRTSQALADEHIFIRPSTDTAALLAMAYIIVTEDLHDQAFLDRYVQGFDEATLPEGAKPGSSWKAYLLGEVDGQPKTPEWASEICGIPADVIRRLAIDYATSKPAALQCGYAPGRTLYGEHFHRAAYGLAALTGSIGQVGGNTGVSNGATGRCGFRNFPAGENPIKGHVSTPLLADFLEKGKAGGYPADIKLIYNAGGNIFNQASNAGKVIKALENVEFIVGQDHSLNPSVLYADIVLPATTFWERNDIHTPWAGAGHYAIFMRKAIEPMYECRNDIDIFADLAARVGIEGYNDKTELEWLRELTEGNIDDFDAFMREGVARLPAPEDAVAFAKEIRDPENHKFATPSGKIELYSTHLQNDPNPYGIGEIPPIPVWISHAETNEEFPLRHHSSKSRARTHSIHANQEKLGKVDPDDIWIHPQDAEERGIQDGQPVKVMSAYGATILPARVTENVGLGITSMKEGKWYTPDAEGVDRAGCANAITGDLTAPSGATTYNTNFVEVRPVNPMPAE